MQKIYNHSVAENFKNMNSGPSSEIGRKKETVGTTIKGTLFYMVMRVF
jgi:hypothetical protein